MDLYLIIVIIMLALAVSGLVVGVANDAVNFLNSALGSKAAPRYVIMTVASVGIIVGAITSNGMMEVARSGVFHPGDVYIRRGHAAVPGGDVHQRDPAGYFQHAGNAYFYYRVAGVRAVGSRRRDQYLQNSERCAGDAARRFAGHDGRHDQYGQCNGDYSAES